MTDRRRADARLAWLIVGCSAALTLALLVGGIVALRGPLTRWSAATAAAAAIRQRSWRKTRPTRRIHG